MGDLEDRLRRLRIELDDETRAQQLTATGRALADARRSRRFRRGRAISLVVAALVVLQVGVVWAAESSLPGDFLYPVKRVFEAPRSAVEPDVQLRHRVEEAERLTDVDPERTNDLIDEAIDARTPQSDADLVQRLDRLRERRDARPSDPPPDDAVTDRPPSDRPATSTTTEPGRDVRPTDTTIPHETTTSTRPPNDRGADTTTTTAPVRDRRSTDTTSTTVPPNDG